MPPPEGPVGIPPARGPRDLPGVGLAVAGVGVLLLLLGHLVLPWTDGATFWEVRSTALDNTSFFNDFVLLYVQLFWIPFVLVPTLVGPAMCLGRGAARITGVVTASIGALLLGGAAVVILSGNVGTDESRSDFAPLIIGMAMGAVLLVALAVGSGLDRTSWVGRVTLLVGTITLASIHVALLDELFDETSFGAWLPLVGYLLIGIGAIVPFRRRAVAAG